MASKAPPILFGTRLAKQARAADNPNKNGHRA